MTSESLKATEELGAKGATHPRVTLQDIENNIKAQYFINAKTAVEASGAPAVDELKMLNICLLVTQNGFVTIGKSASASPENYDEQKGQTFAHEDVIRQLWPVMSYALREKLAA